MANTIIDGDRCCLTCYHCDWDGMEHLCWLRMDENGDPTECPECLVCGDWEGEQLDE